MGYGINLKYSGFMKKLSFALLALFLFTPIYIEAKKKPFGNGLYWELKEDGTLAISGNGRMPNFKPCKTPWYNKRYKVKSIVIEEGVTSIGENSFNLCGETFEIDEFIVPKSLSEVGNHAFGIASVKASRVIIPDLEAFIYTKYETSIICKSLYVGSEEVTKLVIPNGTTVINRPFCRVTNVSSVVIPNTVTSIGQGAFSGYSGLTSVAIPKSVTCIGEWAFAYCKNLTSIAIPSSIQTIGDFSFFHCQSLTSVVIPASVNSIGRYAFDECDMLAFIVIPKSLSNSTRIKFPKNTKIYEGELLTLHDNNSDNMFYLVNDSEKKGMVCTNGKWIIPLNNNYSEIGLLGGEYIKVLEYGNYGVFNFEGKEIIPTNRGYTYIGDYDSSKGTFAFTKKGVSGICDSQGREISTTRLAPTSDDIKANGGYASVMVLNNGNTKYYKVSKSGRYGLTDAEGKVIVPTEMEALESAGTGYLRYKLNGFWGVMNYAGKIIIDTDRGYTSIGDFKTFNKRFSYTMNGYKGECDATGRQISKIKVDTPRPNTSVVSSSGSSSSSSSSNNNSGNNTTTVVVEHKHDPVPMQVWKQCTGCYGSGMCQSGCGGSGWFTGYSGNSTRCIGCGGTGKCQFCAGQGGHYEVEYR